MEGLHPTGVLVALRKDNKDFSKAVLGTGCYYAAARYETVQPNPELPGYLTVWATAWESPEEAFAEACERVEGFRASLADTDVSTYRWFVSRYPGTGRPLPGAPASGKRADAFLSPGHTGLMLYFTMLRDPSREADLHQWYEAHHMPEVMAIPGFTAYHRFINREAGADRRFLILCEVDDDIVAVGQRMAQAFARPSREDTQRMIAEGRLINYSKSTLGIHFRRVG